MSATSHRGGASAIRSQPLRLLARVAAILLAAMTLSAPRTLAQVGTRPARVISLVPSVTEMIFAMGAGSIVVGVSSYDHFPPDVATRPRLGALVDPDFERILTLHPDLVIAYGSQEDLVRRLDAAHIASFSYRNGGLDNVTATVRRLGERLGRRADAERLAARIEADLGRVRQAVKGRPRPRTALIFGRESGSLRGLYASAGVGFLHDLLELAGGDDVFGDVRRESLQVSTEMLLARRPDVVIEIHTSEGWTPTRLAQERHVWDALPALPAVRTGRVYLLADDSLSIPGPRVADIAERFARVLHPDAFTPNRSETR
ncbi:MAG TPA: helical backbone metal receptor [Vicinamibacterales bacterium]|jgi:iron complex transport system substrate-binding protein|nr:helical backbone metal receptor [Vicinamibacterales bacterium]